MLKNVIVLSSLIGSMFSSTAFAAGEACIELIRHAVYDRTAGSSQTASYAESKRLFCKSSENISDNKERANTGASYGLISGFGDFSASQRKEARDAMCDDSYSLNRFSDNRQLFVESLNPYALSVVDNCIRAAGQGLQFKVDYPDDDTMLVSLSFQPPIGAKTSDDREYNGRPAIPAELTCTGKIAEAVEGTHINNNSTDMICHRVGPFTSVKIGNQQIIHNGGSVVISTTAGPIIAFLPKKPDPNFQLEPPKPALPMADQQLFEGLTQSVNAGEISNASYFKNGANLAYGWSVRAGPLAGDALYLGVTPNKNAGMVNTSGANWRGGQTVPFGYVIAPGKQKPSDLPLYVGVDSRCASAVANNPGHQGCAMRLLGFAYVPAP